MRIKTLVALYFWILEFDDVTCIRSIFRKHFDRVRDSGNDKNNRKTKLPDSGIYEKIARDSGSTIPLPDPVCCAVFCHRHQIIHFGVVLRQKFVQFDQSHRMRRPSFSMRDSFSLRFVRSKAKWNYAKWLYCTRMTTKVSKR